MSRSPDPLSYAVAVTAVAERSDLFVECTKALLAALDAPPTNLLVNEDVRPGTPPEARAVIAAYLRDCGVAHVHHVAEPNRGMGPGMLWCFERASELGQEFVLYTQEDWLAVRPVPISQALALMDAHGLHHVRFNKRKTMAAKHADTDHPWAKVEVTFPRPDGSGVQTLCVSDHWYTNPGIWRVSEALPGLRAVAGTEAVKSSEKFVAAFNDWMNKRAGLDASNWSNQQLRHERLRTYIWGPVGEPRFWEHAGTHRGTGTIKDHTAEQGAARTGTR